MRVEERYSVDVEWHEEEECYVARCREIAACVGLDIDRDEAVRLAYQAVEDHLAYRKELGLPPPDLEEEESDV